MKRCDECETQYEDHMTVCLLDGSELVAVVSEPEVRPAPPRRGFLWLGLAGLFIGGGALAVAGVTVVTATAPAAPPVVIEVPVPVPEPVVEPEPDRLVLATQPQGASVFEGEQLLCVTPCDLEPNGSDSREFRLELEGFESNLYVVDEQSGRHRIALQERRVERPRPIRRRPPPPPPEPEIAPVVEPEPIPVPVPAAPAPEPAIKTMSDFKDPFQ